MALLLISVAGQCRNLEMELRLEYRSPQELLENPQNWRTHPRSQMAVLNDVIDEVGWAGACLFNERTGRLIDGHARRKIAIEKGVDKVPVLVGSWDEATEKKILAMLDPIAGMAEADGVKLKTLLEEISSNCEATSSLIDELTRDADRILFDIPYEEGIQDPLDEWNELPEFQQLDKKAKFKIIVHINSEQDLENFAKAIDQQLSTRTRSIWYPPVPIERYKNTAYVNEP